jgi:hypothetical protein
VRLSISLCVFCFWLQLLCKSPVFASSSWFSFPCGSTFSSSSQPARALDLTLSGFSTRSLSLSLSLSPKTLLYTTSILSIAKLFLDRPFSDGKHLIRSSSAWQELRFHHENIDANTYNAKSIQSSSTHKRW